MAFNIKFTGVQVQQVQYEMVHVPWEIPANTCELDYSRYTQVRLSLTYSDSFAIPTPAETLEAAGDHYHMIESMHAFEGGDDSPKMMDRIEQALEEVDFVIARRYECETGMI